MTNKTQVRLVAETVEALTQAVGAASGLIHMSGNAPGFFVIRDSLLLMKDGLLGLPAEIAIHCRGAGTTNAGLVQRVS